MIIYLFVFFNVFGWLLLLACLLGGRLPDSCLSARGWGRMAPDILFVARRWLPGLRPFDVTTGPLAARLSRLRRLAERVQLSKSGLFAHFANKQALQLEVLEHARGCFVEAVVMPALGLPRGEARLRGVVENWLTWAGAPERAGGCLFIQAAADFDDRPGAVREAVAASQRDWVGALARAVQLGIDEGQFRPDSDPAQAAFELHALLMAHHVHARLLEDPTTPARTRAAFERQLSCLRA